MENQSFRDILAGFLEENDPIPPLESTAKPAFQPVFAPESPFFQWENTKPAAYKVKSAYAKTNLKIASEPEAIPAAKPVAPEPKWLISELTLADQRQIKILVHMGAKEINGEISASVLKKAYRRLAKKLHPDAVPGAASEAHKLKSQEDFLALQSIYENLNESIKAISNGKANGNESASAPASQRPNAA